MNIFSGIAEPAKFLFGWLDLGRNRNLDVRELVD